MEFLKENRNIVILIAVVVIGYLLLQTEMFKSFGNSVMAQWNSMSNTMKLLAVLVIVAVAYYLWTRND